MDCLAATTAFLRLCRPKLNATTTDVPSATAIKKDIIIILKLSARPTAAISALPIQLTKNVLKIPIKMTDKFSIKIGIAKG